ncbi:assimilatory nitrite reductase (ferredoxin) precursor [Leptolyngbyaceae cyanobacterium JSC-12]|nr:assimilatory nitrite reductase (ferredoxin) precursor [Leptolyngbyaceae cyanobacterium JSC-12]
MPYNPKSQISNRTSQNASLKYAPNERDLLNSLRRTEEDTVTWLLEPNGCPGLFYGTLAQDGFLIRIRTPGGLLNAQQGWAIATLVERWGSVSLQVTNRANLQIRAVHDAPTADIFQTLQTLGLAAQNPTVDHLRNVMTSPTAGIDFQELIDTRPFVQGLDAYIQSHPELVDLPAKFSIGIDGGGTVGIGTRSPKPWEHRYNEIQLAAVIENGAVYFRLALGGDKQLWDTQVAIRPDECVPVVAALATVYCNYVNQFPHRSKKPRMKHLLHDWGIERYLQQVNQHLPRPLGSVSACSSPAPSQPFAHIGVHPQRQSGLSYIGIPLQLGLLTATQLRELVRLSQTFGRHHLRLTPWQTIVLPDILDEQVPEVLQHLSAADLSVSDNQVDAAIVACSGKPGCAGSKTQTQTHAIALASYLKQHLMLTSPVNIHLTGCPKSCAQPSPADITLLGTQLPAPQNADSQGNAAIEGYQVYVNPGQHHLCDVTAAELPLRITQWLNLYQHHRISPNESFGEFAKWFWESGVER